MTTAKMAGDGGRETRSPATTRPPTTYARVTDAVDRLDEHARVEIRLSNTHPEDDYEEMCLAVRHLCEALDKVMRNNPILADALETFVADACDAVGVAGP